MVGEHQRTGFHWATDQIYNTKKCVEGLQYESVEGLQYASVEGRQVSFICQFVILH